MIYIDNSQLLNTIDPKKLTKLRNAENRLIELVNNGASSKEREEYINSRSRLWSLVKADLIRISNRKCWYCEVKLTRADFHVDHFRPKNRVVNKDGSYRDGYWWLAFKIDNFRLACSYCNSPHPCDDGETRGKWDQFPLETGSPCWLRYNDPYPEEVLLLLDPASTDDPKLLSFTDEGRVRPDAALLPDTYAYRKADIGIEVLNLNDEETVRCRRRVWRDLLDLVESGNDYFELYLEAKELGDETRTRKYLGKYLRVCAKLKEHLLKQAEFSAMCLYCLKQTGEDWVYNIIEEIADA